MGHLELPLRAAMEDKTSDPAIAAQQTAELNRLEEAIVEKMNQRIPARMSEEAFLVKSLRHYDLTNSGWMTFDSFKKGMSAFTAGISDPDLKMIFKRYGQEGNLNFRTFAADFVAGSRRNDPLPTDLNGAKAPEKLLEMKTFLQTSGPRGLIGLASAFADADVQNSRSMSVDLFHMVISEFFHNSGFEISDDQISAVFDLFRSAQQPDIIAYDEILLALKDEPNAERRQAVRAAFRRLDVNSEGLVEMSHLIRCFNANRDVSVSEGTRTAEQVLDEFVTTLKDVVSFRRGQRSLPTSVVAWEEFEEYYKFISSCYDSDGRFCNALTRVWDLDKVDAKVDARLALARPAAGAPSSRRSGLHHFQADTLTSSVTHHNVQESANIQTVIARTRQIIAKKGLRAAVDIVRHFYEADDDVDDLLDVYEFRKACTNSGLAYREAEEVAIFEACGPSAQNMLSVPRFFKLLHGDLSPARQSIVRRAFSALGGDPFDETSTVTPVALKDRFNCEAHPLALKGEADPGTLLAEFLDTFSLLAHIYAGCQNGLVSYSDFQNYYEVVSSLIDNDAYFDLLMSRLWSLQDTSRPVSRAARPPEQLSPRIRPSFPGSPSAYSMQQTEKGDEVEQEHHRRFAHQGTARSSAITKSRIIFEDARNGAMTAVLKRLRESVSLRGLRGWRGLVQKLQQSDNRRNGSVHRLDWQRVLKSQGLGLSPEDQEAIFKAFSANRKDGTMDYEALLTQLRGHGLPDERDAVVSMLFEVLAGNSDVLAAQVLKQSFDASASPAVVLGRRTPAEVYQEFAEAVDFFSKGGSFNEDQFIEFFLMISAIHKDDDEFRLMTSSAFGI